MGANRTKSAGAFNRPHSIPGREEQVLRRHATARTGTDTSVGLAGASCRRSRPGNQWRQTASVEYDRPLHGR